ncbi:inositol polyphosphate kinase-domain-containing protein [Aspergillus avenaceus]|uniref:Kinase n=1 Tax=Aspergillus avenaceus TaxID=36643 RepID=A0A5N6TSV3_ASPAV|nr:inositol polyphosphate kinase-domain-containing protein [Aspergillus avenaceus]
MPSSAKSDSSKTQKLDNDSFVAFDHAAAGHEGVRCTTSGSFIAKPCTPAEVSFYESCALHPAFIEFIPTYIGTLTSADEQQPFALASLQQGATILPSSDTSEVATATPTSGTDVPQESTTKEEEWVPSGGKKIDTELSIVLENVASGFKRPNVVDVKLGARLWADDAPLSKRAKLDTVSKDTTSSSLGYRIAGMKVWTGVNGENDEGSKTDPYAIKYEGAEGAKGEVIEKEGYRRYDKWYGRSFTDENIKEGFETFLAGAKAGATDRSKLIARRLADQLKLLQQVLESEESRMYSSSILVVYEGDSEAMENALEEEKKAKENPKEESEDEDEDFELEVQPDGSYQIIYAPLDKDDGPHPVVPNSIEPESAQLTDLEDEEEEEEAPKVHDLRMIDFAHASWVPGQGPDENVLKGVRNLAKMFDELAAE